MARPPQHLMLLPAPPWPATSQSVGAAYEAPVSAVLKDIHFALRGSTGGAVLDLALPAPHLHEHISRQRVLLYDATQALVANVYRLVCVIAAREQINVEDAEGIDVRVILVARPRHDLEPQGERAASVTGDLLGPVIDIPTLARCGRPWQKVYGVESEDGENTFRQFLRHQDARVKTQRVGGGIVQVLRPDAALEADGGLAIHHRAVIVGGTWDHVHIGHKLLLTMFAFTLAAAADGTESAGDEPTRSLTVGITGDDMLVNKKFADHLQSWDDRKDAVLAFLRAIMDFRPTDDDTSLRTEALNEPGPNGHAVHVWLSPRLVVKLVEISDPYGPTIADESLTALVVSAETRAGGKAVNEKRADKGWHVLQVLEVDVLDASGKETDGDEDSSFESKLSSTSIRKSISERAKIRAKA